MNRIEPSANITIVPIELGDLETYKETSIDCGLPPNRTDHHDTKNFMILMNFLNFPMEF